MAKNTKNTIEAMRLLREYSGQNPFILAIRRDVCVKGNPLALNELAIEYILKNYNKEIKIINKAVKITDWYGESLKEKYNLDFTPTLLAIKTYLGETSTCYHCYVKYKQSMEPISMFLSKKGVLTDFLAEDYNSMNIDFDRYDRLTTAKDQTHKIKTHQKDAVKFLCSRKKCILADDMGVGKTKELSVAAIEGNYDSILIICPQSLKNGWKRELMWYVPERDITIIEGYLDKTKSELEEYLGYGIGRSGKNVKELQQEAKEKGKWRDNRFVIVNFDILDEFYKLPESRSKENIQIAHDASPMLQYIENKKSLIIIDEAHRLSNTSADRYHIVKDLIRRGKPEGIFLATGTPITNNPQNFYNLLNLLDEPVAADWNYYMERYCGAIKIPKNKEEKEKRQRITDEYLRIHGKTHWYQLTDDEKAELNEKVERECKMMLIYKEATNLDELKEKTAHIYLRRTKEDIGDLPNKTVHEMFYELTVQQKQEYDRLWSDYETAQLEADPDKELNKELLEGAIYRGYCSVQMIPNTIKLAENFINNGEKVIIACCYDEELYTLKDYFGDKCVIYNGKMSTKEKSIAEEQFMTNPDKMVFIGNIIAAGVGLNLVASHIIIFNNMSYVSGDDKQFEDRCFRIGQTHDVDIYYQMFKGTQYEKMWNIVLKKELIINQVIKKEDEK